MNISEELVKLWDEYYHYKYMTTSWWEIAPKINLEDFMRWLISRK